MLIRENSANYKMTMTSREKGLHSSNSPSEHDLEWSAEEEIQLFFALEGLKPVGINKHFHMVFIADRLSKSLNRDVPAEAIWTHLRSMYNLDVLDELEPLPFPNEVKEFSLPDQEFSTLLSKKRAESQETHLVSEKTLSIEPPSIIAVITDSTGREKPNSSGKMPLNHSTKDVEKKAAMKLVEVPKRGPKRTRGSTSHESNSPSTTPPPTHANKRRRI